jgi:hypothetical protein
LRAHAILVPKNLHEAETSFENGGSIAERAFDRLPQAEAFAGEGDGPGAGYELAQGLAVAEIIPGRPV